MNYNVNYQIASVAITILLIIFFGVRKRANNFQNKMFLMILICNLMTDIADLIVTLVSTSNKNVAVAYFFVTIYYMTHVAIVALLCLYVYTCAKDWYQLTKAVKLINVVPVIFIEAFILLDFFSFHTICDFTTDGTYVRGPGIYVLYGITIFYAIDIIVLLIVNRKSFSNQKRLVFLSSIGLLSICMAVQFVHVNYRLETFGVSVVALMCFYFIQNPFNQVDSETGLFNKATFYEIMKMNLSKKRDVDIIALVVEDFDDIIRDDEIAEDETIPVQMARFLTSLDDYYNVYRVEKNLFVIEMEADDDIEVAQVEKALHDRFKLAWECDGYELFYKVKICHIPILDKVENAEGIMGFIYETMNGNFDREILGIQDFNLNILERGMRVKTAFANAVENDLFELTFSPIYSKQENKISAFEVSSHFYDDDLGYVTEDEIMQYASCSGQMIKLGVTLFDKACRFISEHDITKYGISFVGIKLKSIICLQYEFVSNVSKVFSKYNIDPGLICFQISEYTVAKVSNIFEAHMDMLSGMGFKFCLDDYGSGFTNLASIYEYPIEFIKIDSRVVRASHENEKAHITLESTLDLANELSMKTIMGGISGDEEFELVSELICDYMIGSYFYENVDERSFLSLLRENAMAEGEEFEDSPKKGRLRTLTSNVANRLFRDNKDALNPFNSKSAGEEAKQ